VNVAGAIRVGNVLGAGRASQAKLACKSALIIASGSALLTSTLMFIFRNSLGYIFIKDEAVVQIVRGIIPIIILYLFIGGILSALTGIICGMGRQKIAAAIGMTNFYLIALPLGSFLGLVCHWGLIGIWSSMTFGSLSSMLFSAYYVRNVDWDKEVGRAKRQRGEEIIAEHSC